jgi:hypothetical protein
LVLRRRARYLLAVVAVGRDAVAGKVEEHTVVRADLGLQRVLQQLAQLCAGRVEQRRVHLEAVLLGQQRRQPARVIDGGPQR